MTKETFKRLLQKSSSSQGLLGGRGLSQDQNPIGREGEGHLATVYHCLPHSTQGRHSSWFTLPSALYHNILNWMWPLGHKRKFGRGKEGVRYTTLSPIPDFHTSCQITTLFQQHCINPRELLCSNFSLNSEYLEGPFSHGPAPTRTPRGCAAPSADSGHLSKSNPTRSCLWNTAQTQICLLTVSSLPSPLSQPSKTFKRLCLRGIFQSGQGKCAWPLLQHTARSQQMDTVKGLSPAPQSRLINSSLK